MATFGKTSVGGSTAVYSDDVKGCTASPASEGRATKMTVYIAGWGSGENIKLALYDAADESLFASTEELDTGGGTGWYDFDFSPSVEVLSTKSYRLAFYGDNDASFYYDSAVGQVYPSANNAGYPAWPDPVTTAAGFQFSIYCTYTPSTVLGLTGTITGTSSITGAIGANPVTVSSLAGIIAGVSEITGAIGANPVTVSSLAGTIAGISTITGALLTGLGYFLSGTIAGTSSISGALVPKTVEELQYFPSTRPGDYDPDLVFDEDTGTWGSDADLLHAGGSRHRQQLVVATTYFIYYEALT